MHAPLLLAALLLFGVSSPLLAAEAEGESRVTVLPLFLVRKGEPEPSRDESERLMRHIEWSQKRYRELLGGAHSFELESKSPEVYRAEHDLNFYRRQPEGAAPRFVAELLRHFRVSRTECRSVYLIVVMNPYDNFPNGGGRPINGGYGTGGGVLTLSSYALDRIPNFQSTLRHELGHSFGLPHVNSYGYSMSGSPSIMSYNPAHHTDGFHDSETPGTLIPEDRRGLAKNQRVFPGLRFDPATDVPAGYRMHGVVVLKPMTLPTDPPPGET